MNKPTIAFIGCGHMARSLIAGLIAGSYPANKIWAADINLEKLEAVEQNHKVHVTQNNQEVASKADIIVLGVLPNLLATIANELKAIIEQNHALVISVAAAVDTSKLNAWFGNAAIVRTMPNTPAIVGSGVTALYANALATDEQKNIAETILRSVGVTIWLDDEALLDTVTVLSGCGPAYFLLIMETLEANAMNMGLDQQTARLLTLQTALGTAKMALESQQSLTQLRLQICPPGGVTEQAINSLEKSDIREIFRKALESAKKQIEKISSQSTEK